MDLQNVSKLISNFIFRMAKINNHFSFFRTESKPIFYHPVEMWRMFVIDDFQSYEHSYHFFPIMLFYLFFPIMLLCVFFPISFSVSSSFYAFLSLLFFLWFAIPSSILSLSISHDLSLSFYPLSFFFFFFFFFLSVVFILK